MPRRIRVSSEPGASSHSSPRTQQASIGPCGEIIRLGWRAGEHAAEQLRTYVHRLRHKLEPLDLPCQLLSQHGQGYCLTFNDRARDVRVERSEG